jgi:hypothetical protein
LERPYSFFLSPGGRGSSEGEGFSSLSGSFIDDKYSFQNWKYYLVE